MTDHTPEDARSLRLALGSAHGDSTLHVLVQLLADGWLPPSVAADLDVDRDAHVARLTGDGWRLAHPTACRRGGPFALFDCPYNDVLDDLPDVVPGDYVVRRTRRGALVLYPWDGTS